jgi:transcriptional regulator with XRE-family HTH domain
MHDFSVIRSLRKKRELSADQLAAQAGLTRATVTKMEAGEGNPTVATLEALAKVLGVTGSDLLRLSENGDPRRPEVSQVRRARYRGKRYRLGQLEVFHLQALPGRVIGFDPGWHGDTGEMVLLLKGRLRLHIGGRAHDMAPGDALGFMALHEHSMEVLEEAELLIVHHSLI